MTHIVTKAYIEDQLNNREGAALDHFIGRALVVLMNNQTADEKRDTHTKYNNKMGFTSGDGKGGTLTAFYYLKNQKLLGWQRDKWTRPNRIAKYWRQLDAAAQIKAR
jgi:hypothetical protein